MVGAEHSRGGINFQEIETLATNAGKESFDGALALSTLEQIQQLAEQGKTEVAWEALTKLNTPNWGQIANCTPGAGELEFQIFTLLSESPGSLTLSDQGTVLTQLSFRHLNNAITESDFEATRNSFAKANEVFQALRDIDQVGRNFRQMAMCQEERCNLQADDSSNKILYAAIADAYDGWQMFDSSAIDLQETPELAIPKMMLAAKLGHLYTRLSRRQTLESGATGSISLAARYFDDAVQSSHSVPEENTKNANGLLWDLSGIERALFLTELHHLQSVAPSIHLLDDPLGAAHEQVDALRRCHTALFGPGSKDFRSNFISLIESYVALYSHHHGAPIDDLEAERLELTKSVATICSVGRNLTWLKSLEIVERLRALEESKATEDILERADLL